jgi:hypothetical protein
MKCIVLCATLIVSKSKLEYIKLHGFFKKKIATVSVHRVENIRCQNDIMCEILLYPHMLYG